jgi:hypothetical protein
MYGSQDLQVCIHECRVTAEDELYVASLAATRDLNLLDLTHLLYEEHVTEFESLDMAVHMLFLAGPHSYEITRLIAQGARAAGYDGVIYPSYFSLLRTGGMPFETAYGISLRRFPQAAGYERAKIIPTLGLFGRPVREGTVARAASIGSSSTAWNTAFGSAPWASTVSRGGLKNSAESLRRPDAPSLLTLAPRIALRPDGPHFPERIAIGEALFNLFVEFPWVVHQAPFDGVVFVAVRRECQPYASLHALVVFVRHGEI